MEKSKYGWFWQCPTGDKCIYRHALPPGFVLKKDKKKEDKKNEISLEDLIEKERAALGPKQTRITLETFLAWKKRKIMEKEAAAKKAEEKKRSDYKAGRQVGLSGREMFNFNPELAAEQTMEDGDEAFDIYAVEDDGEEIEYKELNFDLLGLEAREVCLFYCGDITSMFIYDKSSLFSLCCELISTRCLNLNLCNIDMLGESIQLAKTNLLSKQRSQYVRKLIKRKQISMLFLP